MRTSLRIDTWIAQRRAELAELKCAADTLRAALQAKEYNPNQPRISAHQSGGGRWMKDGASNPIDITKTTQFRRQLHVASRQLEDCEEMNRRDLIVCKFTGLRTCYAQAMVRLVACENGHPIPPLNF